MEAWPDDFLCPITLEVMTDPVILPSGHTFERRSIQQWLDGGHLTCPVTNLPLPPCPPLIPNHALRRLIAAVSPSAAAAPVPTEGGAHARQEAMPARSVSPVPMLLRLAKSGAATAEEPRQRAGRGGERVHGAVRHEPDAGVVAVQAEVQERPGRRLVPGLRVPQQHRRVAGLQHPPSPPCEPRS